MKKYLTIFPLLAALMLPSCSTLSDAQRDLNQMEVSEYEDLKFKVSAITAIASSRVAQDWDAAKRAKALDIIAQARTVLADMEDPDAIGELGATDLIRALAEHYGEKLGLDEQGQRDIKDAALLIDAMVGPIKLDIDGKLGERERGLILALLDGLENGLE